MAKRTLEANYFADDKDIFDLLVAARQKLTPQRLVELARRRGIILSSFDNRDELIERVSMLPFGWHELNELIAATDTADRAENVSSRAVSGAFTPTVMEEAMGALRDSRAQRGETYKVERHNDGLRVEVGYSELDTSRTRLVQRTQREFTLEVEFAASGSVLLRHEDQPRAQEVLAELVTLLATSPDGPVEQRRIELGGIRDPARRTEFFIHLIHGIGAFKFEDVKAVKASQFQSRGAAAAMLSDDDQAIVDDLGEPADADSDEISTDEASFIARVKEIAIKGDGILKSSQYEQLSTEGFFVRSIVWTAVEEGKLGPRVELEAGFDNPEDGTGFTYGVRGVYGRKADGDIKKSRSPAAPTERTQFLRLLEAAASAALALVTGPKTSPDPETGASP